MQNMNYLIKILIKKRRTLYLVGLVIAALYSRLSYYTNILFSEKGFVKTQDAYWYIEHAKELIEKSRISIDLNGIFYLGYYGLLAIIISVFKTENALILIQFVVNALSVILVYKIAEKVFNTRVAIISGILYILSYEMKFWCGFILTDSLFVATLLLCIYALMKIKDSSQKRYKKLFLFSLIYMTILRPTGAITVAFLFLYFVLNYNFKKAMNFLKLRPVLSSIIVVVASFIILFAIYKIIFSSIGMSFYWNLRWLFYVNYSSGHVFDIPTPYDHKFNAVLDSDVLNNFVLSYFSQNWVHILILYIKRFISFWGELWIWHFRFNNWQEAYRYFLKLAPILIMLIGMIRSIYNKSIDRVVILFIPIITSVIFCMVFFIDSGWRYRIPSIPFSRIFMAYGIDSGLVFLSNFIRRNKEVDNMLKSTYEQLLKRLKY